MLKVYGVSWCPHCRSTVSYLIKNHIDFQYFDIERQPENIVKEVVDANGGIDWIVPTLKFHGQWRPGKKFSAEELKKDLQNMGILLK